MKKLVTKTVLLLALVGFFSTVIPMINPSQNAEAAVNTTTRRVLLGYDKKYENNTWVKYNYRYGYVSIYARYINTTTTTISPYFPVIYRYTHVYR